MRDNDCDDIVQMVYYGNVGFYKYCEIIQIVIHDRETKNYYNFFTHVEMKSIGNYEETIHPFVTNKLLDINKRCSLAIKRYNLTIDEFLIIYKEAGKNGVWKFRSDHVLIDSAFETGKKYIPETNPTAAQYELFVPISFGLYGTNSRGNFYIYEIFSKKEILGKLLNEKDLKKICEVIDRHGILFDFNYLNDRIGNIFCRFDVEVLSMSAIVNSPFYGIELKFTFSEMYKNNKNVTCILIQEHDNLITKNEIVNYSGDFEVAFEPNQCKNSIYVVDNNMNINLFVAIYDFTSPSDYMSEVTPDRFLLSLPRTRKIEFDSKIIDIKLNNKHPFGDIYEFIDLKFITERQKKNIIQFNKKIGYFLSYKKNEKSSALKDLYRILSNNILWDIEEILVIDPYLSAKDIIESVMFCPKHNLKIRALTSYKTAKNNKETKKMNNTDNFNDFKEKNSIQLKKAIGMDTDLKLEFRTVYKQYGYKFHDRFLIINYGTNRSRVWSLGTSINSIGNNHHIIQKVDDPEAIVENFDEIWAQTKNETCRIFSNF